MKMIERNQCVISGKEDLELLYRFDAFPVFMGCVDHPPEDDLTAEMAWWISRSTGCIQMNPLLPLDVLYGQSHGSGCIGGLWKEHHQKFSDFVESFGARHVLEIGGGHGYLAHNYVRSVPDADWSIVEPNPTVEPDDRIHVQQGFFDDQFRWDREFDAFVHSHVLEHIYQPMEFMQQISRFLGKGKRQIFSIPNLHVMLERKYTNCINFEHTVCLTEPFIEFALHSNGLEIERKEYFKEDHSIFYSTIQTDTAPEPKMPSLHVDYKDIYDDYIRFHEDLIADINDKVNACSGDVFLFGAHVFAQYLLGFGLDTTKIKCILDNDPNKQEHRLYGSSLQVHSPKVLRDANNPHVILRAGVYNQEIKEDILSNINPNVVFWE